MRELPCSKRSNTKARRLRGRRGHLSGRRQTGCRSARIACVGAAPPTAPPLRTATAWARDSRGFDPVSLWPPRCRHVEVLRQDVTGHSPCLICLVLRPAASPLNPCREIGRALPFANTSCVVRRDEGCWSPAGESP